MPNPSQLVNTAVLNLQEHGFAQNAVDGAAINTRSNSIFGPPGTMSDQILMTRRAQPPPQLILPHGPATPSATTLSLLRVKRSPGSVGSRTCNAKQTFAPSVSVGGNEKIANSGNSRRISSDDSGETEPSDPKKWFDRSNKNPGQLFGPRGMDGE